MPTFISPHTTGETFAKIENAGSSQFGRRRSKKQKKCDFTVVD